MSQKVQPHLTDGRRLIDFMSNAEIIAAVNRWQSDPSLLPLTCCVGSKHRNLIPVEAEGRVNLACPDCDFRQDVPEVVLKAAAGRTADLSGFSERVRARLKKLGF